MATSETYLSSRYDKAVRHLGYNPDSLSEEAKVKLVEDSQRRLAGVKIIPDSDLTPTQLASLSLVRSVAKQQVHAADIPPASDRVRTAGMYSRTTQDIYITPEQLSRGREAVNTVIHELAHHRSGAEDDEAAHSSEIARIASEVVETTSRGEFDSYLAGNFSW